MNKKTIIACVLIGLFATVGYSQIVSVSINTDKTTTQRVLVPTVAGDLETLKDAVNTLGSGAVSKTVVVVTDTNAYTVLAANSGKTHIMPDLSADSTFTMPAEAAGMYYRFAYAGGAADAHDWIIDTGADVNYFVGGIVQFDPGSTNAYICTNYYSDGNSNSKIGVLTPESGTVVEMWCSDGVTWYVTGSVVSDTAAGVTFADQ